MAVNLSSCLLEDSHTLILILCRYVHLPNLYTYTLNNTVIVSMQSITSMTLLTLNNIHASYCKSSNALLSYSSETHVSWFTHHNCKYVSL